MKNIKRKISVFNRYLILLIVFLFLYLFYLSIPGLYNYERLQRDLTTKLSKEFNLNASLSGNITYKILPTPNFEILNVILNTDSDEFAQIKKMKVYISALKLQNQKNLEIKKIVFLETNFNINKNSFKYINNYFKKKSFGKKIEIKKSKVFFRESKEKKDAIVLYSIKKSKIFYDKKNNHNKMNINGSIFNTKFDLNFLRNIENQGTTKFELSLKQISTSIKNELIRLVSNKNHYKGKTSISILDYKIKTNYNIKDKLILISSDKSTKNKKFINLSGKINTSPFYYDIKIDLEKINIIRLVEFFFQIKNLLQKNILLHKNFNGKFSININSLSNIKLFDQANINLKFANGKLIFDDTVLISKKIGKLNFIDSKLIELNEKQLFKAKILFEINNSKEFYQTFQISKNNRIKLNDIYLEIEHNLNSNNFNINQFLINSKFINNSLKEKDVKDLTDKYNIDEIQNVKNWIELKKFANQIFSEIN